MVRGALRVAAAVVVVIAVAVVFIAEAEVGVHNGMSDLNLK